MYMPRPHSDGHAQSESDLPARLRRKIADLTAAVDARDRRIRQLELDVADREARIIAQADMLTSLDTGGMFVRSKKPVAAIVSEILQDFPDVTWDDIVSVRRTRALIKPRHLCMLAVYEQRRDLSLPAIGRIFKRDHTSILFAVHKMMRRRNA